MAWDHSCIGLWERKCQSVLATDIDKLHGTRFLKEVTADLPPGFQIKTGNFTFAVDSRNLFAFSVFLYQHNDSLLILTAFPFPSF